jgi:hypothetical protein
MKQPTPIAHDHFPAIGFGLVSPHFPAIRWDLSQEILKARASISVGHAHEPAEIGNQLTCAVIIEQI